MTTKINLLPWREELRKEQDRQLFVLAAVAWMLMGVVVGYGHFHMTARIDAQNARNNYLKSEISKLDKQIKEIRNIKKKRAALVARMNVIYRLQADRTKLVYVMDGLVKTIPEGVYYTSLTKNGNTIKRYRPVKRTRIRLDEKFRGVTMVQESRSGSHQC